MIHTQFCINETILYQRLDYTKYVPVQSFFLFLPIIEVYTKRDDPDGPNLNLALLADSGVGLQVDLKSGVYFFQIRALGFGLGYAYQRTI